MRQGGRRGPGRRWQLHDPAEPAPDGTLVKDCVVRAAVLAAHRLFLLIIHKVGVGGRGRRRCAAAALADAAGPRSAAGRGGCCSCGRVLQVHRPLDAVLWYKHDEAVGAHLQAVVHGERVRRRRAQWQARAHATRWACPALPPLRLALVTRASATTCRLRKKMSVCSSTDARPAICAFLHGRAGVCGMPRGECGAVRGHALLPAFVAPRRRRARSTGAGAGAGPTHLCRRLRLSTTPCISSRSRSASGSGRSPSAAISTRCTSTSA